MALYGIWVYCELSRMWKEAVVVCFKILSQHLSGGIEENNESSLP
jgi:hypothetical protein